MLLMMLFGMLKRAILIVGVLGGEGGFELKRGYGGFGGFLGGLALRMKNGASAARIRCSSRRLFFTILKFSGLFISGTNPRVINFWSCPQ